MNPNSQNSQGDYKRLIMAGATCLWLVALFIIVVIIAIISHWSVVGGERYTQNTPPQITVNGTGYALVTPDIAEFTYSVIGDGTTVQDAQTKATNLENKAAAYLKQQGVDDKDIQTQSYDITPQYVYPTVAPTVRCINCPPTTGSKTLTGYEVTQSVLVKVRKTDQAGTILAGIGSLGVQNVSGLNLTVDDPNAVAAEARQKAIDDAKAQAEKLASQLGVHLVRIASFSEQGSSPIYYSRGLSSADVAPAAAPVPNIPVGQNKVTSNVTITYEIR